jgi:hypothetical protein
MELISDHADVDVTEVTDGSGFAAFDVVGDGNTVAQTAAATARTPKPIPPTL